MEKKKQAGFELQLIELRNGYCGKSIRPKRPSRGRGQAGQNHELADASGG